MAQEVQAARGPLPMNIGGEQQNFSQTDMVQSLRNFLLHAKLNSECQVGCRADYMDIVVPSLNFVPKASLNFEMKVGRCLGSSKGCPT